MDYTLIGSQPSPFVRRLRMLMHKHNIAFTLKELNIYETDDGIELNKVNPINQIPVLLDGEKKVWNSRVIYNYLNSIHKLETPDLDYENNLSAIEGALEAGVGLFLMKRSGINIQEQYMVVNRYKDRIDSVLNYLKPYLQNQGLNDWNFLTMTIYSFLDWGTYRGVLNITERPECAKFLEAHSSRPDVQATQIPKV